MRLIFAKRCLEWRMNPLFYSRKSCTIQRLECGVSGCYLYMFFRLACLILGPQNMTSSSENRKTRRKHVFKLSTTKVRSHYASQVVDLLTSFPKSGHMPKTELRVKIYGCFKFRIQCICTGFGHFLHDQSVAALRSVHLHEF